MKNGLLRCLVGIFWIGSLGAEPVSPTLQRLQQAMQQEQPQALAHFWQQVAEQGAPLLEEAPEGQVLATFLWRALPEQGEVRLLWPSPGINTRRFDRLPGTDLHYLSLQLPPATRASYQIAGYLPPLEGAPRSELRRVLRAAAGPDSLHLATTGQVPLDQHSLLELSGAPVQPWIQPQPGVPRGDTETWAYDSPLLGNQRQLTVYKPPGFAADHAGYPLLLLFDEQPYLQQVPTPVILDNLIAAGRIPPLVAVLIGHADSQSRGVELPCNPDFGALLSRELLPWLGERLPLTDDPALRVLAGSSYGGLAAACYAFMHPDAFQKVLAQSGSFWWGPEQQPQWLVEAFQATPRLPLEIYMDAGLLEDEGPDGILGSSRRLAQILADKGYVLAYREFVGGHDYALWRGTLSDGLEFLLGPARPVAVKAGTR